MRSGIVAVAGRPNVGKSTLVNALCGGKVAIVSDKPQTTRRRIHGVANGDGWQLVLADLPGFQRPRDALTERMQRTVDASIADVDAILFVLNARERIGAGDRFVADRVYALELPVVVALNKVDQMAPGRIAQQIELAARLGPFHALHPVSAKTRYATKRSPAPIRSRAESTKRTPSTSSRARSTVRCIRSVRGSRGRWNPGRSMSTSWYPSPFATPAIRRRVV